MNLHRRLLPICSTLFACLPLIADGPADNVADKVRRIPPAGVSIPEDARRELSDEVAKLGVALEAARTNLAKKADLLARLPDVAIFHKSVDWALRYDEFFRTNEIQSAHLQLQTANERLESLLSGSAPWTTTNGLVVAGYVSKIDGSVQPYGLVIPKSWQPDSGRKWRLDFWFHGRGEQLSELSFLADRMKNAGEFTPPDTFVLHLYGRYCNGSRFAGETDFWEAFDDVKKRYPIDEDRLVERGFSLGGASAWHFATHHAWRWAAAAPGAGFSETAEFLNVFQKEKLQPAWWEQKLWRLYDSTANALNVSMVPLVAYSGEDDGQIQAAKAMREAMSKEGLELAHVVGPKTGHKYEANAKAEINRRIDTIAAAGRVRVPPEVRFVTHSLRYNRMAWVTVDAMGEHWEPARVLASLPKTDGPVRVAVTNVEGFTLTLEAGDAPFAPNRPVMVEITGGGPTQLLEASRPASDRSWQAAFHREDDGWKAGPDSRKGTRKKHGQQGPIDDAFMDSFVMVLPTGTPMNEKVGGWVASESARAIEHWRRHYRGDVQQRKDTEVTVTDVSKSNLVLWGDPASNAMIAKVIAQLPIKWTAEGIKAGTNTYAADGFAPVLIYPNPLNPNRYVVINSGFTFREYDYLNNARQTPKLPDWAIIDLSKPSSSRAPGGIANAGFFGERWELR